MNKSKTALLSLTLLTLIACGKDDKSSSSSALAPQMEVNPVCAVTCQSTIDWKIRLQGQIFPAKSQVDVNGQTVLDECKHKQKYAIDREAAPQMIFLTNYLVPTGDKVSIHIIDRGSDCSAQTTFLKNDEARFEVMKLGAVDELEINL